MTTSVHPTTEHDAHLMSAAERLRQMQAALRELTSIDSLWRVVVAAPRAACVACDFDRATLSHVRDGRVTLASVSNEHDPQLAADFARVARAMHTRLTDAPPELEAVTAGHAVLVQDAQQPDTAVFRPLARLTRSNAYVVAPIVCGRETLGLLHADRFISGRPIDELDRDLLWTFATGVGWAMQQAVDADEPAAGGASRVPQSAAVAALEDGLSELVREWADVPAGWARRSTGDEDFSAVARDVAALGALTAREREVLELMVGGASNQALATVLVISEATVKSHVRQVLRKLGAVNRTEAVARYHGATRRGV